MTLLIAGIQEHLGHIAVLRNEIGQVVELVACFNVVRSAPTAFKKRHVLVELIMLVRIVQGEVARIWGGSCVLLLLQVGRQWRSRVVNPSDTGNLPNEVRRRGLPSEVMIILKEISKSCRQNHAGRNADVGTEIVGCIW